MAGRLKLVFTLRDIIMHMNFNRIQSKAVSVYLADPYCRYQALKRSTNLLRACKQLDLPILILGNKNRFQIDNCCLPPTENIKIPVTRQFIMQAVSRFSVVVCLDPMAYISILRNLTVPVMIVATGEEIAAKPEIAVIADYLIPQSSDRLDAALGQVLLSEVQRRYMEFFSELVGNGLVYVSS